MSNKVVVSGIDTNSLPKPKDNELEKLMHSVKLGSAESRQEFIFLNMRLVLSIVQRFNLSESSTDDVFQVGIIGLIKAIDNFDESVGVKFSTYAVPMIIGEIKRYLRDSSSLKVTRSLRDIAYKALLVKQELQKKNSDEPSIEKLASALELPVLDVALALDACVEPVSLYDSLSSGDPDSLLVMDQIKDPTSEDNWIEKTIIEKGLINLPEKEKNIIIMRYFTGKTQTEISSEIGISQAQVSRLEKNALKILRSQF